VEPPWLARNRRAKSEGNGEGADDGAGDGGAS
jgi:hypothetical protein